MYADWFSEAVSGKPQTEAYLLPRMALTLAQPDHPEALRYCCHQMAMKELAKLHDEDRLTEDHCVVMFGLGNTIYHTILTKGNEVVYDFLADQSCHYDTSHERYRSSQGDMMVKAVIPVDEFFRDYVSKVVTPVPSAGPDAPHPSH